MRRFACAPRLSTAAAGRFGEPQFWQEFYLRKSGPFEWFVDAAVAARALKPLLPRRSGSAILHLGCGTSALGPLLAADGFSVVNVDYDQSAIEAARGRFEPERWARRGGSCEWQCGDMRALPADWTGRFDAVVDKGGLCAAIFAGEAHAASACREAARCLAAQGALHYITDDAPEQRVDLLRAALPDFEVTGASIDADEDEDDDALLDHHRREYYVYSASRM
eukprot:Transcript_21943.p2 GENE.Transcript_21943~~Transcript_21943.p2  ORF type:complete len:222 (+),score=37.09 Transcript_21943:116-781(+)